MLKTSRGPNSERSRPSAMLVFTIGGRRLATRAEEVGGVWPWTETVAVPSRTPYLSAVVRRGEEVLPVYDLAARLGVTAFGEVPLCLIARRQDGPMVIRIDGTMPTMRTVGANELRRAAGDQQDVVDHWMLDGEEIPVYSLATLGLSEEASSRASVTSGA